MRGRFVPWALTAPWTSLNLFLVEPFSRTISVCAFAPLAFLLAIFRGASCRGGGGGVVCGRKDFRSGSAGDFIRVHVREAFWNQGNSPIGVADFIGTAFGRDPQELLWSNCQAPPFHHQVLALQSHGASSQQLLPIDARHKWMKFGTFFFLDFGVGICGLSNAMGWIV